MNNKNQVFRSQKLDLLEAPPWARLLREHFFHPLCHSLNEGVYVPSEEVCSRSRRMDAVPHELPPEVQPYSFRFRILAPSYAGEHCALLHKCDCTGFIASLPPRIVLRADSFFPICPFFGPFLDSQLIPLSTTCGCCLGHIKLLSAPELSTFDPPARATMLPGLFLLCFLLFVLFSIYFGFRICLAILLNFFI